MRTIVAFGASMLALGISTSAMAQSIPAGSSSRTPQDPQTSSSDTQEIVVTALRREQTLLSAPLSIQAASGQQLATKGIQDLTSLRFVTPGYTTASDSGFTQIFIRGVGNSIYVGADPSVAQFVDDVPRIYGTSADTFFDVERVEVLKGAQGGLYGRNATGGVVNIITRQPSTETLSGNALMSYGERNTLRAAAYLNVPLSDKIAVSLAAERDSHDGYVQNRATATPFSAANFPTGAFLPVPNGTTPITVGGTALYGYSPAQTASFFNNGLNPSPLNDQDFWAINGKILLRPSDNFKITLAADYYNKHDNSGSGWTTLTPQVTQAAVLALFSQLGINASLPDGFIKSPGGKFTGSFGPPSHVYAKEWGVSGTMVWNLPGVDVTSITAYRHQKTDFVTDNLVSDVFSVPIDIRFPRKEMVYQELRLVSTFEGPLHLLGGASYLDNIQESDTNLSFLSPVIPAGQGHVVDKVHNWSVYAQVGYDLTSRLNLTASGRYIWETNQANFSKPVDAAQRSLERKFVPAATLSYRLDGGTVYVRWARGFKAGGIDFATAPIYFPKPSDGSIFKPETVDTYEAGYRQALFDKKVQLTTAVFYNDYRDLQVLAHPAPGALDALGNDAGSTITTAVINANSARTYGVEASVSWHLIRPLTIGVNLGWLNAKYKDFKLTGSTVLASFDRSGRQMLNAPKFQAAFNADLNQPLTDSYNLVASLLVSHTSSQVFQNSDVAGVPDVSAPGYWIANARIGIRTADERYGIALVADNLFNKAYFVQGTTALGSSSLLWGNPRIIRGEVTAKF